MSIVWVTSLLKPSLVLISATTTTTVGKLHSFVGWVGWLAGFVVWSCRRSFAVNIIAQWLCLF